MQLRPFLRLSTVTGYTLWTLTKEKKFEKLPQKVSQHFLQETALT